MAYGYTTQEHKSWSGGPRIDGDLCTNINSFTVVDRQRVTIYWKVVSSSSKDPLLVNGREGRSLLDLVCAGKTEKTYEHLDLSDYAMRLADTLSSVREIAADRNSLAQESMKKLYDKNSTQRSLEVGSLAMCRIPGLKASLTES